MLCLGHEASHPSYPEKVILAPLMYSVYCLFKHVLLVYHQLHAWIITTYNIKYQYTNGIRKKKALRLKWICLLTNHKRRFCYDHNRAYIKVEEAFSVPWRVYIYNKKRWKSIVNVYCSELDNWLSLKWNCKNRKIVFQHRWSNDLTKFSWFRIQQESALVCACVRACMCVCVCVCLKHLFSVYTMFKQYKL